MWLSDFILLFDFNRAGEETHENNCFTIIDYTTYEEMFVITTFEEFQNFITANGDFRIAYIAPSHSLEYGVDVVVRR